MDVLRIRAIEYLDNGTCRVGTETANQGAGDNYQLSEYCYRPSWLSHFQKTDLETIWQLTKRQLTISPLKRCFSYLVIKSLSIRLALRHWEEEAKRTVTGFGDDFDDW